MDGERLSRGKQSAVVLATVVRQFTPSRVERELLAQVFQMAWRISHRHSERANEVCDIRKVVADDVGSDLLLLAAPTEGG